MTIKDLDEVLKLINSSEYPKYSEDSPLDLSDNSLIPTDATALAEALILRPWVNIVGLDDNFLLAKRASNLAKHIHNSRIFLLNNNDSMLEKALDEVLQIINVSNELLLIWISALTKPCRLDEIHLRYHVQFWCVSIKKLMLTTELIDKAIAQVEANSSSIKNILTKALSKARLKNESIEKELQYISSTDCSENFYLNLRGKNLMLSGAYAVASVLKSGKCQNGLILDLEKNNLGSLGASALADVLKRRGCPEDLTLILGDNNIRSVGAIVLAHALRNPLSPQRLTLNLANNNIRSTNALVETLILKPGLNILGLEDNFPQVKRASQLAQQILLLWQAGDDENKVDAAYSQIVETIQETPELLAILISQLIITDALNDTERHAYAGLINALINQLKLTTELKDRITNMAANTAFEDVVKNAGEMTSTRGQLPARLTDLNASYISSKEIEKQIREVLSADFYLLTLFRDEIATFSEFSIKLDGCRNPITQANLGIELIGFLGSLAALIFPLNSYFELRRYIPILYRLQFKVSTPDSLEKIEIEIPRVESCLRKLAFLTKSVGDLVKSPKNTMASSSTQQVAFRNGYSFFISEPLVEPPPSVALIKK